MIIFILFSVIKIILIFNLQKFLIEGTFNMEISLLNMFGIFIAIMPCTISFLCLYIMCVCLCAFKNSSIKSVWFTDEKCLHSFDVYCSFFSPPVMYYALFSNVCLFVYSMCLPSTYFPSPHTIQNTYLHSGW